jgi:putative ABC transport system permease protein
MTATLDRPITDQFPDDGGVPARRAVIRWAWRLFVREWRQQLLILMLVVVAVGATIVASAVAANSPQPANFGFGTAQDRAVFQGTSPQELKEIAWIEAHEGPAEVVENQTVRVPGSINTFQLRAQKPHGRFSAPMLSLVSGRYPTSPGEVAMTQTVASELHLEVGDVWHHGGAARRLVGIVLNPQSLLDEFALVAPGQVTSPALVIVLFDAHGAGRLPGNVQSVASVSNASAFNPETISIAGLTIGMILIALVAVGGFTVLAQRRLRSLGMLESLGATDAQVGLVVRANGTFVGVVGAVVGAVLGIVIWLVYRPHLEQSSHHLIATFALSWPVVAAATILALVATYLAAGRPARAITRVPVMDALSGRPPTPGRVHRTAIPGIICLVLAFVFLGYSGASGAGGSDELVFGLVLLVAGLILVAPFFLAVMGRVAGRAPVAPRLALRDLSRYRARSGAALAAISLGILIAMVVALVAAARYANVLDYAGPNLTSSQLVTYTPNGSSGDIGPGIPVPPSPSVAQLDGMARAAEGIGPQVGADHVVELLSTTATLLRAASGQNFSGPVYVATPQLLSAYGIEASQVQPDADILTMRPGLSSVTRMQLVYGDYPLYGPHPRASSNFVCPKSDCVANPVIQEVSALPPGTSAPNTLITEHAVHELGLPTVVSGWLVQAPKAITASQISNARIAAAAAGMSVETKNSQPTSAEIIDYAVVFGTLLALAILAMSVGLIRSEAATDLRILAATGASSTTRRTLTATTTGALAFAGAILGTAAAYLALVGYLRANTLNGGLGALGSVPMWDLVAVLVLMPLAAALGGWILGGREPAAISRQPIE